MSDGFLFKTDCLGFRPWRHDDLGIAQGLWGDHRVTRLIDARGKLSKVQVQELLAQEIACREEHGVQYWPIFLLESGAHLGCCGLRPYDLARRIYEIGIHIRSDHWRRGYAYKAAGAVIDHAFKHLEATALFAGHNPKNENSRSLLEKLGFQYTHDEYYPPTGLDHPSYSLTADDYLGDRG